MPDSHREDIERLESLYSANPGGRVFTHLAEAYRKAGDLGRALEILEAGLDKHTDYASAHVVLGRVYLDRSDLPGARAAFTRVLELDPHNMVALRSLGDVAIKRGEMDEALRRYRALATVDPGNDEIAVLLKRLETAPPAPAGPPPAAPAGSEEGSITLEIEPTAFAAGAPDAASNRIEVEPTAIEAAATSPDAAAVGREADLGDVVPAATAPESPRLEDWTAGAGAPPVPGSEAATAEPADGFDLADIQPDQTVTEATAGDDAAEFTLEPTEALPLIEPTPDADLGALAGGVDTTESVAEGGTPETPEWMLAEEIGPGVAGRPVDDSDVITETMGDLYLAQGLYGRAIEVYRELLEQRPGDDRLTTKLAQAESDLESIGGSAMPAGADSDFELEPPPAEDLPMLEPVAEPAAGAPADPLAWETALPYVDGQGPADPEDEPLPLLDELPVPLADEPAVEDVESVWTGSGGAVASEDTMYAWVAEAETDAGPTIADYFRDLLSWRPASGAAAGARATVAPQEAAPTSEPAAASLDEFDELFGPGGGLPSSQPAAPPASGRPAAAPVPEPEPAPEPLRPETASAPAPNAQPSQETGGDDEDLEMFRSWLQSLKR